MLSKPQTEILRSDKQVNLFLAGVGTGKTHLAGAISLKLISSFPKVRGFIGANTYDQLNTSTLFRIREFWASKGITEYNDKTGKGHYVVGKMPPKVGFDLTGHNFKTYNNIISFCNGTVIFLGSMDNAIAHDGKEFGWAILDETKDTDEQDVKDIILPRLRQKGITNDLGEDLNPLFIFTSPAKVDWINKWFKLDDDITEIIKCIYNENDYFVKSFDNKKVVIASTYWNRHNLPDNYIENKKLDWTTAKVNTLIYANPFNQSGGEYISSFNRLKHVGRTVYDPDYPIHVTFDFNAVPYNSCSIWQIFPNGDRYSIHGITEVALSGRNNSTEDVCDAVIARFKDNVQGLYYYGDATGKARTTMSKEFKHQYEIINSKFRPYLVQGSNRIPAINPPNLKRRDFLNNIFDGKYPIDILIDPSMVHMIDDLMFCKQDTVTGMKDKKTVKDKETGDSYQKYGHLLDGAEYFLCYVLKPYFKNV